MRDFLYSEIANWYGVPNFPDYPDIAIRTGTELCKQLLEPIQEKFGRIAIRSAYRSPSVNQLGNEKDITAPATRKTLLAIFGIIQTKKVMVQQRVSLFLHF